MNWTMRSVGTGLVFFLGLGVAGMQAQQPVAAEPQAPSRTVQAPREVVPPLPVPRLVKFAGTLKDELGKPRTGVAGVTFAIYKEQEGGAALWLETQNVELDEQGRYTVLLGSTKSEGLPLELFTAGEPRWLGVQANLPKEVEQPRVLLVSVPYALKASDADTLGGKSVSSFVLASPATGSGAGVGTVFPSTGAIGAATIGGGGTQNFVAKFDATGANVINSSIFDTGTNVGLGTASPARSLHIRSAAPTIRLEDTNLPNSFWELQQSAFVLDTFGFLRYENGAAVADKSFVVSSAGNLGIGTGTPQRKLHIRSAAPVIRLEDTNLPNSFWELQQSAFVLDTFGFLRYENGAAVQSKSFVMSSAGNFGIGTGTPGQKLEVAGNVKISGAGNALVFPDGTVMTSAGAGTNGGTITGVTAGTGLTGGGTTGGVTLNIANGGVTNALLGANSVTNANIADGSVSPAKITGTAATLGPNLFTGSQLINGSVGIGTTSPAAPLEVDGLATDNGGQAIFVLGGSSTGTGGTAQDGIDPVGGNASGSGGFAGFGVFATGGNATAATSGTGGDGGDFIGGSSSGTSGFGGFGVFGNGGNATAAGGVAGDGGDFVAGTGSNGAANGLAALFNGDIQVTGAITAGTKDFKIDHPLDPANKYLVHASVESSEMLNIYTGNATLDASGSASVPLPGWFEVLNKDFRYQLTAIGAPGPNLYIAQEIQGGRFVIAGGQPGMKDRKSV